MSTSDQPPDIEHARTRSRRIEEIFVAALDVRPEERAGFLERACAGDDELRRAVEGLLAMEGTQTLDPLPPGELAVGWGVADFHSSLKGLSLAPGRRIGRYALLRSLGQGGMGTVFLAHDTRLHRRVAIKFLHTEDEQLTKRFLAEARATARCKHENIVVLHDVDEIEGRPFIVLEHLEGEPLRQRLAGLIGNSDTASATPSARRREAGTAAPAMPVVEVLELVIPVVRALVCAHAQGIVHRDLKPENVFLCRNGTVKVLDFGIAKALIDPYRLGGTTADVAVHAATLVMEEPVITAQGARLGTLPYMSPEQWGAGEIDERTDIWAVGIMLYEMLAGRHPLAPLSYARLAGLVPDPDTAMPAIGDTVTGLGALAALVDGCLRKRPAERIASAQELLDALVAVNREHTEGRPQRVSVPLRGLEEPSAYLAAYAAWARQKYEYLPMRGLGGLRLDLRLDDVHVPLELMPHERGRFGMGIHDNAPPALDPSTCTVRLEEAFGRAGPDRHLFVRGDPGTGKTTALIKMLWSVLDDAAEHGFDGRALGLTADTVPVFLPLRSLAGPALGRDFEDVLDDALVEMTRSPRRDGTEPAPGLSAVPPGFGRWLWQRGHVLLLLDGLDEIADPKARAKVCRYIENVLRQAGPERLRAVVSSRFAGIQEEDEVTLDHRRFLHLDVRHLDDEKMVDLVNRWFTAAGVALDRLRGTGAVAQEAQYRIEAQTVIELLRSDAYASRQLKELVSTPLFLTLLCIVVFQGGQIPERRAEFFRECLRVLLMPWARRDGEQRLSLDESLDLLQHIAWYMHREQRRDDLGEAELRRLLERPLRGIVRHRERKLNVSSVIDWFRRTTGALTEYATVPVEYGFLHLSLQEYLAARYAATYPAEGIETLATHFGSSWWREVALLFVALPEYRHFGALMEQVTARGKLVSEREHVYQCLLEAHVRDLRPFLARIADRGAPIAHRIEALRLVRDQDDDELIELASEIALELWPEEAEEGSMQAWTELRLLGEQVEAHAPPRVDASRLEDGADGVLVICDPADEAHAGELEKSMKSWGWHADVAVSPRIADEPWRRAHAFVVLVGPEGRAPWQQTESRQCLVEMVRRELSMASALSEGMDASALPGFLQTRPHASLGEDVLESRLPAVLAGMLEVPVPKLSMIELSPEEGHAGQSFVERATGIRFLWVPGGRFWMGSGADEEDAFPYEKPRHLVEISGYWLAETPVTNRQYEIFLREQYGSREPRFWRDRKYNQPEQPVVGVSWLAARAFCRWLSELSGQWMELPTEAQWERAARGTDGRKYPWGDEEPNETRAHYGKSWDGEPMPVGRLTAGRGPFGHLDLAGNVWEWCRDAWDDQAYEKRGALSVGSEGPDEEDGDPGAARTCRGGAFVNEPRYLRSAFRFGSSAVIRYGNLGFRIAALPASR